MLCHGLLSFKHENFCLIFLGVFDEHDKEEDQMKCARHNVFLLYESGFFVILVDLLNLEAENGLAASSALRKPALSITDSTELR